MVSPLTSHGKYDHEYDGRPRISFVDKLLNRLIEHHGEPRYDIPKELEKDEKR
jgi:hypothetical protein